MSSSIHASINPNKPLITLKMLNQSRVRVVKVKGDLKVDDKHVRIRLPYFEYFTHLTTINDY